jgi:hypothetical protein
MVTMSSLYFVLDNFDNTLVSICSSSLFEYMMVFCPAVGAEDDQEGTRIVQRISGAFASGPSFGPKKGPKKKAERLQTKVTHCKKGQ